MARPTADTAAIALTARALLAGLMPTIREEGITLVGISLTNLDDADEFQLELPFGSYEARHLDAAVDLIRDRYGTDAISRGALLGRDPGVVMPLLPD